MLDHPLIDYIGEIGDEQKSEFLGNARALLFPIDWPEPFGLVMIEAMACGTPVIAWNRGSVPEVIDQGVTGYIVDSEEEALAALSNIRAHRPTHGARRLRAALRRSHDGALLPGLVRSPGGQSPSAARARVLSLRRD